MILMFYSFLIVIFNSQRRINNCDILLLENILQIFVNSIFFRMPYSHVNPCLSQIPEHKTTHFATMDIDYMNILAVLIKFRLSIEFLFISFLSYISSLLNRSIRFFHMNKLMHFEKVYSLEFCFTLLSFCALW